jgi:hypothetical protein
MKPYVEKAIKMVFLLFLQQKQKSLEKTRPDTTRSTVRFASFSGPVLVALRRPDPTAKFQNTWNGFCCIEWHRELIK